MVEDGWGRPRAVEDGWGNRIYYCHSSSNAVRRMENSISIVEFMVIAQMTGLPSTPIAIGSAFIDIGRMQRKRKQHHRKAQKMRARKSSCVENPSEIFVRLHIWQIRCPIWLRNATECKLSRARSWHATRNSLYSNITQRRSIAEADGFECIYKERHWHTQTHIIWIK